jgi:hypothetical protein
MSINFEEKGDHERLTDVVSSKDEQQNEYHLLLLLQREAPFEGAFHHGEEGGGVASDVRSEIHIAIVETQ